jgi:hypothetical protein
VSFWSDVASEASGGVVTAVILGAWALRFTVGQQIRQHDERIVDLEEDNRRWFRDRDAQLRRELVAVAEDLAARNMSRSSIADGDNIACKHRALHDYRDELTGKRRRYRQLLAAEGWSHARVRGGLCGWRARPLRRFELTAEQRDVLDTWRTFSPSTSEPRETRELPNDPTSEELEPDLRRFEREGDPPLGQSGDDSDGRG